MGIIENNEAILGNNRSIFGEILNRIIGRKNRIIGTALEAYHMCNWRPLPNNTILVDLSTPYQTPLLMVSVCVYVSVCVFVYVSVCDTSSKL